MFVSNKLVSILFINAIIVNESTPIKIKLRKYFAQKMNQKKKQEDGTAIGIIFSNFFMFARFGSFFFIIKHTTLLQRTLSKSSAHESINYVVINQNVIIGAEKCDMLKRMNWTVLSFVYHL